MTRTVCFKRTENGRKVVLVTEGIGKSPIVVKAQLVEKARRWGLIPVSESCYGSVTSLSPQSHLKNLCGIQIMSHDNPDDFPPRISFTASTNEIPYDVVKSIISDVCPFARECTKLNPGIAS